MLSVSRAASFTATSYSIDQLIEAGSLFLGDSGRSPSLTCSDKERGSG